MRHTMYLDSVCKIIFGKTYFFSFDPLLVSVGELRQKLIELHTIKTKNGNLEVETTVGLEVNALLLSVGHVAHTCTEIQKDLVLVKNQSKIASRNM